MSTRAIFLKTSLDVTAQTLPLALAFATDCICAIIVTGMFRDLPDATVSAAVYSTCLFASYFVTFAAKGFHDVSTALVSRAQEKGDDVVVWQVARRDILFSITSTFAIACMFCCFVPLLAPVFWPGIPFEVLLVPIVATCLLTPVRDISQSVIILCRALGEVRVPAALSLAAPMALVLVDFALIPAYGLAGALCGYWLVFFLVQPGVLVALMFAEKLPFKRVPGAGWDKAAFSFHFKKAVPSIGTCFVHKAGNICISFACGTLSPAAMLAVSLFLDIVDASCSVGQASCTPLNSMSSRGVRCLFPGVVAVLAMTAFVLVPLMICMPTLADALTADAEVRQMLLDAAGILVAYVVCSNVADVLYGVLVGRLLNEQVGGWSIASMLLLRCIAPFFAAPLGFVAIVACYALNRILLMVGYSVIAIRHRDELR